MPGKIKAKIICARNLPIMDRSSDSSDAFVEVRFGANHFDKTHVFKRSLDPEWNSRFVFEVEEDEIQEEPLLIRVLDHDTYSSHDAIGKVYIDLKPLLNENGPTSIHGFLPIYDTLHGIRGEIKVQAKVEIINDCNEYRKSSCGVQFFASSKVPEGYTLQNFCGFVEELLLNDDPEYQWIDKIRTPRTSNEARQKLFTRLSGELQRRIGLKVLDMNANCVLGYQQNFDLEGEHGIVIRGIGTAANISKPSPSSTNFTTSSKATTPPKMNASKASFFTTNSINASQKDDLNESTKKLQPHSPINNNHHQISINTNGNNSNLLKLNKLSPNRVMPRIHSDSDIKTYQNQQQQISNNNQASYAHQYSIQNSVQNEQPNRQSMLEKMEYPFLTIQHYPPGFIKSLCGIVCSRSVKLLGQSGGTSSDMTESRDKWWSELRNEIRSHMKSLNCHAVLGYSETESICEDVCILSAFGTAALVDESYFEPDQQRLNCSTPTSPINYTCKLCHVPYSELDPLPLPVALSGCSRCEQGLVPDVVFTSIQPLAEVETVGRGCLIRAMVTRPRKKSSSEVGAKLVSDNLPFVEYELHRQLLGKLKLKGMNMLYGLRVEISIGENVLIGIAEATACFAAALPTPIIPRITGQKEPDKLIKKETDEMEKLRKLLIEEMDRNRAFFQLEPTMGSSNGTKINRSMFGGMGSGGSVEKQPSIDGANDAITIISQQPSTTNNDSSSSSKALFKIELDDVVEKDNIYYLLDYGRTNKKDLYTCSTEFMPGLDKFDSNVQMFTSVYRCEISQTQTLNQVKLNEICEEILETLRYKFRRYPKLCFANLSLSSSLYDDDYVMLIVTGSCLTFDEIDETNNNNNNNNSNNSLEGNNGGQLTNNSSMNSMQQQSPSSSAKMASDREMTANDEEGKFVDVTNLSYVPNGQIEAYLGFINIFLIRESTQIKENGGLSGFMHCFLSEVLALARAHVRSLGGNALVSCRLNQCVLLNNPHRNQAQCLVNVSGDAVRVVRNSSSYNLHRTF